MPQLDKFTFATQIIWSLIIFFLIYLVLLKYILPQLSLIIKLRIKFFEEALALKMKYKNRINADKKKVNYFRNSSLSYLNSFICESIEKSTSYNNIYDIYVTRGNSFQFFNKKYYEEITSIKIKNILIEKF